MDHLPGAFSAMAAYSQFIVTQLVPDSKHPGKTKKFPYNVAEGEVGSAHDPALWMTAQEAIQIANAWGGLQDTPHGKQGFGVGFVLTEHDPFWFIDIDNATVDGQWIDQAATLCGAVQGCAVELSQSGTGLHLIGSASARFEHRCKNPDMHADLYTEGRFIALTGIQAAGDAGVDFTAQLGQVVATYFPPKQTLTSREWTTDPRPDWDGIEDDVELIIAANSKISADAAFGKKAAFTHLWHADEAVLGRAFPDDQGVKAWDGNRADMALAQHLAFWTGCNCERMERIMYQSALVRDKWEDRPEYVQDTIMLACAQQGEVHSRKGNAEELDYSNAPESIDEIEDDRYRSTAKLKDHDPIYSAQFQLDYFKNCVYVAKLDRILTPSGELLNQSQFKNTYGGAQFAMDIYNKGHTKNAWEAFTQSRAVDFPKALATVFKPQLTPFSFLNRGGQQYVNCYIPLDIDATPGNIDPFLNHLRLILPIATDREILLAYMAAAVQHKGIKFQWAPLLQGVEGNGKSLISEVLNYALGDRYCHWPKSEDIDNKFNSWMLNKLMILVEDIYVPDGRREMLEALKPMVTGKRLDIQAKGVDQVTLDVCANFIFNSNHRDAIRKTRNDRRFCVFYTAQQSVDDLTRDGITSAYFREIYGWLDNGGYAHVTHYLAEYDIPDHLNPAGGCTRAPITSATEAVIQESLGTVEQAVLEAVDSGKYGFKGGFISSYWLNELLEELRRNVPLNKRKELLESIGYYAHPGLKDGRVNNALSCDGQTKSRIYVKKGHPTETVTSGAEIAKLYESAQAAIDL